jgi:hypothetical protein
MIMSDLNTGMNKAFLYDQRIMGKGVDALCSLRLYDELQRYIECRDAGKLDQWPDVSIAVRDNCMGQNKSKGVLAYSVLTSLLFYKRSILHFLGKGHSHMRPDQVTAWLRRVLSKRQIYSPLEIVELFNTLPSVQAEFFDSTDPEAGVHPFWGGWKELLKQIGIVDIPSIG